jgi:hypothetical protein
LKAGTGHPSGHGETVEDVVGDQLGAAARQGCGKSERETSERIDGATECDDAGQALGTSVGRGLIAEHAALRVARQMHPAAGVCVYRVDHPAQRDDMVAQSAFEPTGFPVR